MKANKKPGFFIRLLAVWIDALFIFLVLKLFFYLCLALPIYVYFPFEFTFIVVFIVYSITCRVFKKKTLGKQLLNKSRTINWLAAISLIIFVVYYVGSMVYLWNDSKSLKLSSPVVHPFENRDPNLLQEVSSLSEQDYSTLSAWIENNGKSPEEYVIQIAQNHKVTLVGESHGVKNVLDFFNDLIPNLYYDAGVRCIAMEVIPSSMNGKIEKLIDSNEFDANLFIDISRSQGWQIWGMEEYWEVLKSAWKLNKNLQPDEQRLRVVGIDSDWEGPNFALVFNTGDDGIQNVPFVEKFRAFTVVPDVVKMVCREEIMARNIEKEAIETNDKCVVLIGYYHSFIHYGQAILDENKQVIRQNNRMGVMLSQKYTNDIFQIALHANGGISDELLNKVADENGLSPVGFTVANSPFALLHDSTSYLYANLPTVSFCDVAQGYLYLMPFDKRESCTWMPGYVSKKMYMKYKPFYEGKLGRKFKNNGEINDFMMNNPE